MLTQAQYNNLWTVTLGLPIQQIPCYYQYLQREVYFQDYLDLFCCPNNGGPTFVRVHINGYYTIDPGFVILHNPAYTIQLGNQVRLIVDYDFPYAGQLCKNREIKYILIGEAAHPSSKTYFYNINHTNYTPWFAEPVKAWGVLGINKRDKLIGLADNEVLLLDLSPFAISYDSALRILISTNLSANLNNRINKLICLNVNWNFCFIAPKETSIGIINWLAMNNGNMLNGKTTIHVNDLLLAADYVDGNGRIHQDYAVNNNPNQYTNLSHLSKRAKLAVIIGGSPHHQLINRAF